MDVFPNIKTNLYKIVISTQIRLHQVGIDDDSTKRDYIIFSDKYRKLHKAINNHYKWDTYYFLRIVLK